MHVVASDADHVIAMQELHAEWTCNFQKYTGWTSAAAATVRCSLNHVLSTLQVTSAGIFRHSRPVVPHAHLYVMCGNPIAQECCSPKRSAQLHSFCPANTNCEHLTSVAAAAHV